MHAQFRIGKPRSRSYLATDSAMQHLVSLCCFSCNRNKYCVSKTRALLCSSYYCRIVWKRTREIPRECSLRGGISDPVESEIQVCRAKLLRARSYSRFFSNGHINSVPFCLSLPQRLLHAFLSRATRIPFVSILGAHFSEPRIPWRFAKLYSTRPASERERSTSLQFGRLHFGVGLE